MHEGMYYKSVVCYSLIYLYYKKRAMMDEKVEKTKKKDRLLGDEWENWAGDLDESMTFDETARLFTIYATVALLLILGGIAFTLYMIEPRLVLFHPMLAVIANILTIALIIGVSVWSILVIVSVFTGKNFLFYSRLGQITATRILPFTMAIARHLGISRDRLGNSFVSFSNAIVKASHKPGKGKTIILLPRCLKSDIKKEVKELGNRAGIEVFTATGGGQARKIIKEHRPTAVIGVACERDLVSGIHDVAPKMPTLGVTNKRPEGPCKNTLVDMDKLRKAIETLTGVSLD